jgi:hypothetical protein
MILTKSQVFPQNLLMAWIRSKLPLPYLSLERQVEVSPAKTLATSARKAARMKIRMFIDCCRCRRLLQNLLRSMVGSDLGTGKVGEELVSLQLIVGFFSIH